MTSKKQNNFLKQKTQIMEALLVKTRKEEKANKTLTATKATIQLGARVFREGHRLTMPKFLETIGAPTHKNLDALAHKFGISWNYALDGTLPKEAKSGPARSFVVAGKTESGVKVFYDRFQFILFIGNKREKVQRVVSMNKRQFEKLALA